MSDYDDDDKTLQAISSAKENLLAKIPKALSTLDEMMDLGEDKVRLQAALAVLDRTGLERANKLILPSSDVRLPVEAITAAFSGLAALAGKNLNPQARENISTIAGAFEILEDEKAPEKSPSPESAPPALFVRDSERRETETPRKRRDHKRPRERENNDGFDALVNELGETQ